VALRRILFLAVVFFVSFNLSALDFYEGKIKLTVNDKTGGISLYYLKDSQNYEPLFNDREDKASFISINVDGAIHKLGFTNRFLTRVENNNGYPSVIFESPNLVITESFTPVRTTSSQEANGIKMTITVRNVSDTPVSAGFRILLDTSLGEVNKNEHFITDRRVISKETLFRKIDNVLFWVSKDQNISLMGSIVDPINKNAKVPDFVHFASWRRLYNASWALRYSQNRSFNYSPYSMHDSGVGYYWEPEVLAAGRSFIYSIYLTTEDFPWYGLNLPSSNNAAVNITDTKDPNDDNLLLMYRLKETLNKFLLGEIQLEEQELDHIESEINRLKDMGY
jgi:hypothetical protein